MITSEDLEKADNRMRYVGKIVGDLNEEAGMRELHGALCNEAQVDFDAAEKYIRALVLRAHQNFPISNLLKDVMATVVRHAFVVGVQAARIDEERNND